MISLIINTCSLDPLLAESSNPYRAHTYAQRRKFVQSLTSWAHQEFDEVIVTGFYEEGPNYRYVHVKPRFRDRRDALYQREYGSRYSKGDVFVYTHDDHAPAQGFAKILRSKLNEEWDILVPERRHSLTADLLNNGKEDGYMGGHTFVMRRWVWAETPWFIVDTEYWDVTLTRIWEEKGAVIRWVDDLVCYDLEAAKDES